MKKFQEHKHYWLGENRQHWEGEETIIKMSFPRCFIRYKLNEAYFADIEEFYSNIAEVQWFDGEAPSEKKQKEILIEAWNFLAIEERILEQDLEYFNEDD